jgi:DNA-directed RNA polymerase I, II, and III subunit RPABC5
VIGNKYESYTKLLLEDTDPGAAMTAIGLKRYCCRRMVLTHVDLIDKLLAFSLSQGKK